MSQPWTGMPATMSQRPGRTEPANLADILERVLDKGIVIAGDIRVDLLDIELLTIRLRLLIASVNRAKEMGIDWWEHDPTLSSSAGELAAENERLRTRLDELQISAAKPAEDSGDDRGGGTAAASSGAGRPGGQSGRGGARQRSRDE